MTDSLLSEIYAFAQNYHSKDKSGHGFDHIRRVYENACRLLEKEKKADTFVVKAAALLHDVDDHKLGGNGNQAQNFLQSLNLPADKMNKILAVIKSVGFSESGSSPDFASIEQALVSDADKLDAMGAIGICRTLVFGASRGGEMFNEMIFPKENLSKEEYKNLNRKENNSINHFFDKLLKLKNAIKSEAARAEAQKRHDYMVGFLREFFAEQNLAAWNDYLTEYLEKQNDSVSGAA